MIEETAKVVDLDNEFAVVEMQRKTACESCSINKGCGTGVLSKVLGKKANRIKVLNRIGAVVNDHVVVGIEEDALVQGSFAMYAVPLITMLIGALLAQLILPESVLAEGEGWVVTFAIAGLAGGFLWLRKFAEKVSLDDRYQPVILRLAESEYSLLECER